MDSNDSEQGKKMSSLDKTRDNCYKCDNSEFMCPTKIIINVTCSRLPPAKEVLRMSHGNVEPCLYAAGDLLTRTVNPAACGGGEAGAPPLFLGF